MKTPDSRLPEDFSDPAQVENGGSWGPRLLILLGIALLLLVGIYLLLQPRQEIELQPPPAPNTIDPVVRAEIDAARQRNGSPGSHPAAAPTTTPQPTPADRARPTRLARAEPPAPNPAASSPSTTPGETARALIRALRRGERQLNLDEVHAQANRLQVEGRLTDAYLLYFYAARQGHGPSAFALGTMNDPAYFTGRNKLLEGPDPVQAYKWYSIAAANQVEEGRIRLTALRKRTEKAAAGGDPNAQRLLLNWK